MLKRRSRHRDAGLSNGSRICVYSQRNLQRMIARCVGYEFEDVVCEVDDVDLLAPEPYRWFALGERLVNRLGRHISASLVSLNPGIGRLQLDRNYELFFAVCMIARDLLALNALKGWREQCRTAVCCIDETWVGELHKCEGLFRILSKFDYVILNCSESVQPIEDAIRRSCFYLPPGVDAIRFCPYPNPPPRPIDVYSIGRRSSVTHQSLYRMAEDKEIFYIYDTIYSGSINTLDHVQHRSLLANIAKRSRYFVANTAKIDEQFETRGQSEVGYRFFEGAASGAVMIGEPPDNQAFKEHFDWSDAVVRVPFDTVHIAEVLAELDSQPDRLEAIRNENVVQSLLRHDWLYRWKAILELVGLEPRPALLARENRLRKLAELARNPSDASSFNAARPELALV